MTYQVLARKYRPQSFHDVVGQDAVVQTLLRALATGRVAHAFLFTGSRGVGKTTLARILARCLTCETGVTGTPCGTCRMCKGIGEGSAVDVIEIDGASNTGVDQVRDLQEMARYLPQTARFKIFIIDEVHMLSTSAFNALLKTLEEPPPHLKFIFATTEPHKLPVTVLSRCQRYDFRRIPSSTIIDRLMAVLAAEHVSIERGGLEVIARAAEGGMRDALSLTDQVLSFAGAGADKPVRADEVIDALGLIDRRTIVTAVEALLTCDATAALRVVEAAFLRGHDLKQLLAAIAEELRHLSVAQAASSVRSFADLSDDDIARIDARAKTVDPRDAVRLLGMALDGIDLVGRAEDARLGLELVMLRICRRAPIGDALLVSEALMRLEALSKGKPVPPLVVPRDARATTPLAIASQAFASTAPAPAPATPSATTATATATASPPPTTTSVPAPTTIASASTHDVAPTLPSTGSDGEDEPVVSQVVVRAPVPVDTAADEDVSSEPTVVASAPATAAPVEEPDDDGDDPARGLPLVGVDPRWIACVDRVARAARPVAMHLDQARVVRVLDSGGEHIVEVAFARDLHRSAINNAVDHADVRAALSSSFGPGARLVVVPGEPPASAAPSIAAAREEALAEAQRALEAHAKSHPVVQKAVALFGGEVRSVKRA